MTEQEKRHRITKPDDEIKHDPGERESKLAPA